MSWTNGGFQTSNQNKISNTKNRNGTLLKGNTKANKLVQFFFFSLKRHFTDGQNKVWRNVTTLKTTKVQK